MTHRTAYRSAAALAVGTAAFLVWSIGALGIVGVEGDPADLMYLASLAFAAGGALVARFRAEGMTRAMLVTAGATVSAGLIALALGKHEAEYSSVLEILGLTAMFASMFAASAWLFRLAVADRGEPVSHPGGGGR